MPTIEPLSVEDAMTTVIETQDQNRELRKRITELEVAVRRGVSCIEKLVPYVMWDGIDGEDDQTKVQITLDLMRQTITR